MSDRKPETTDVLARLKGELEDLDSWTEEPITLLRDATTEIENLHVLRDAIRAAALDSKYGLDGWRSDLDPAIVTWLETHDKEWLETNDPRR